MAELRNLVVSGNANISGTLNVGGATTLNTLGVSGATTLSSTLNVSGATTLNTLNVSNATTLNTLNVSNATTLSSTLGVSGATTLNSTLNINNILYQKSNDISISIGALNKNWVHIYNNTNDVPFIFNKSIYSMGGFYPYPEGSNGTLGNSSSEFSTGYVRQIYARHLDASQNYKGDSNLYLQYNTDSPIYFNGSTYYIKGSYYNGKSEDSNKLGGYSASNYIRSSGSSFKAGNKNEITQPGGDAVVSITTTNGLSKDIGIFYLSQDNAYIANSSDNGYTFAVFDTDNTLDFSGVSTSKFAVPSGDTQGIYINGNRLWIS